MPEERTLRAVICVPDLLAALTAYGLGGAHDEARHWTPRKGAVMKHIARFFDWLSGGIAEGERMRREAYLAQSSDHCDLENRIRELERESRLTRPLW